MSQTVTERIARRDRWEDRSRVSLILVGVVFIVAYSLYVLLPDQGQGLHTALLGVLAVVWVIFLVDFVVRWAITPRGHRGGFVRHNVVDLMSVIVPVFRAFRVVALLGQIPYFRGRTAAVARTEVITFAIAYAVIFVYFLALATLNAEQGAPGATITTFGDAVWWACVTITTVGYGDTYPVTTVGRVCAVMLMAGGSAIVGTASALVISYLNERVRGLVSRDGDGSPS